MLTEVNVDVERGMWTAVTLDVEEAVGNEALVEERGWSWGMGCRVLLLLLTPGPWLMFGVWDMSCSMIRFRLSLLLDRSID